MINHTEQGAPVADPEVLTLVDIVIAIVGLGHQKEISPIQELQMLQGMQEICKECSKDIVTEIEAGYHEAVVKQALALYIFTVSAHKPDAVTPKVILDIMECLLRPVQDVAASLKVLQRTPDQGQMCITRSFS